MTSRRGELAGLGSAPRARRVGIGLGALFLATCAPATLHAESNDELAAEIKALKAQIREMRAAISETRSEGRRTQAKIKAVASRTPAPGAAYSPPNPYPPLPPGAIPAFVTASKQLQFGAITITPGGFIAGESVFRTKTLNSDMGTASNAIPFNSNPLAHTNEWRPSARNSRFALLAEGAITPSFIAAAYGEFDFLSATNTANSNQSNSYTPRIRHLYVQLDNTDYGMHVLAGQAYSLVTLNTKGITPRNELTPNVIDGNQTVGSIYARQAQIRLTKDFNRQLWVALSAEESENTFQPACATAGANGGLTTAAGNFGNGITNVTCGVAGQQSNSGQTNYSLNHVPDVIAKAAYEGRLGDRDVHVEGFGLYTDLYDRVSSVSPTGIPMNTNKDTTGYGVGGGVVASIIPRRLDIQANVMYGRGIGRYAPGQIGDTSYNADGSLRALPELIGLVGATFHATPSIDLYAYAGYERGMSSYYTNPNGTFGGVGGPGINDTGCYNELNAGATPGAVCNGANKRVLELTGGFWDKIYKGSFGEVRAGIQYAYFSREIYNNPGAYTPRANLHEVFTSLRYYPFQ